MSWYLEVLKKYAQFDGRAARTEFWMYSLINAIIVIVLQIAASSLIQISATLAIVISLIAGLYSLGVLIPSLAVAARRLHDTGRSGWWILISFVPLIGAFVLLYFCVQPGTPGENQFGSNPLDANAEAAPVA